MIGGKGLAHAGHEFVDGNAGWLWLPRGLGRREAQEMAVDPQPHLLVSDLVALQVPVGAGGGEFFVDGDFVETLREEVLFHFAFDAAEAGELAFGVGEFGS